MPLLRQTAGRRCRPPPLHAGPRCLPPLARTGAVLAVPLTSVLRILCNHLIENNIGMPYISAISSLLEGRSLDLNLSSHKPTDERDPEAAPSAPKDVKS